MTTSRKIDVAFRSSRTGFGVWLICTIQGPKDFRASMYARHGPQAFLRPAADGDGARILVRSARAARRRRARERLGLMTPTQRRYLEHAVRCQGGELRGAATHEWRGHNPPDGQASGRGRAHRVRCEADGLGRDPSRAGGGRGGAAARRWI